MILFKFLCVALLLFFASFFGIVTIKFINDDDIRFPLFTLYMFLGSLLGIYYVL